MVYTGKPSKGCGMCKSRRIKVGFPHCINPKVGRLGNMADAERSVMKNVQYAANARRAAGSVLATRTNLI
jgi:hypothetical protein